MTDWPAVVREYGPLVWRTAHRLVGNEADAADCFQMTFLAALELAAAGPVRHWGGALRRLTTARGLDLLRARHRAAARAAELADPPDPRPADPLDGAAVGELAARLREALATLDPLPAEVFCLVALDGLTNTEAAAAVGVTANHAGVLLHRARAALRDRLRAADVPPGPPPDLAAATVAALAAADATFTLRRRRMRLVRALGATAALAAAVTLAVVLGTGSTVSALDAAVAKAKNAKSVKFVTTLVVKHPDFEPQVSTVYYQGTRMRVESGEQVHIADFPTSQAIVLHSEWKYAWRAKGTQKFEPPLDRFNKFVNSRGRKEGTDDVAGVKADRYRITPDREAEPREHRLWVDPRTGWPVKLEAKGKVDMTGLSPKEPPADYTATDDRYEWDVPLDEKLFRLDVPPGYELGAGPVQHRPGKKE